MCVRDDDDWRLWWVSLSQRISTVVPADYDRRTRRKMSLKIRRRLQTGWKQQHQTFMRVGTDGRVAAGRGTLRKN